MTSVMAPGLCELPIRLSCGGAHGTSRYLCVHRRLCLHQVLDVGYSLA